MTAALIAGEGDATPIAFVRAARDLEAQIAAARKEESIAEADLASRSRHNLPAIAEQWRHLVTGALALDYDARMQVRQLVAETFSRIVIYHCGITPETGSPHIDLVLMAKGGTPRMLRIDRKSGAWMAQEYGAG